jgi:YD repeat-containing protein
VSTLSQTDNDLDEPETESWSGGPLAGRSVTTSRDSFGRRQGVTTSVAGFQAQNVTAYDPAGRPAIIIAGNHTATYRYVANSRIRAGVTYRANGTQRLDTQYDFDRLNRLQQVLNQPSAAGQPAERHAYTYNAAQQRIRDELADGSSWSWESDPLGRRIGRIVSTGASGSWVPTSTTRWLYEGWNPVAELNGAGTLVHEYVWGTDLSGGGPHGCRQSPAVEYEDPG